MKIRHVDLDKTIQVANAVTSCDCAGKPAPTRTPVGTGVNRRTYLMPVSPRGVGSSGASAMVASVVIMSPATEAAFCNATLVTLATPAKTLYRVHVARNIAPELGCSHCF